MTIYALPSGTIEATLTVGITGLAGSLGVTIIDLSTAEQFLPRTTLGITEGSSGVYTWTGDGPPSSGDYSILWDEPVFLVQGQEDLVVNPSGVGGADSLCSLADVREALEVSANDTSRDELIAALIPQASQALMRFAEREFAPAVDGQTRLFALGEARYLDLTPYDLRAATLVKLDPDTTNPTTLTAGTDYRLAPVSHRDGVYGGVYLNRWRGGSWNASSWAYRQVSITGDWGFAIVPDDVRRAAILTVAAWTDRSSADFADIAEGTLDTSPDRGSSYALPTAARLLVQPYRRMSVA